MKILEKTCVIRTFAAILVVQSLCPHKNTVSLRFFDTCSVKRFIRCNSDNSVKRAIIIRNTFLQWQ